MAACGQGESRDGRAGVGDSPPGCPKRVCVGGSAMDWVKAFAIAAGQNWHGNDAKGSFLLGARRFGRAYRCPWWSFDNLGSPEDVRGRFLHTIETYCPGGTNLFAYFGHGTREGLLSAHVGEEQHIN